MNNIKLRKGQKVKFHAVRIFEGNPVIGTVVWSDQESFTVTLDHRIIGINMVWYRGDEKTFRWDLVKEMEVV